VEKLSAIADSVQPESRTTRFLSAAKGWIAPRCPGSGKSTGLAFVCGFLLGPIGIGLYLRSLTDALLVLCINVGIYWVIPEPPLLLLSLVGGGWGVARVVLDTRRCDPARASSRTAGPERIPDDENLFLSNHGARTGFGGLP